MGAVQSQEITGRQYARVEKLIARVTAAPATELTALKALCPDMQKQVDA